LYPPESTVLITGETGTLLGSGLVALLTISLLATRGLAQTPTPIPPGPPPNPARPPLAPVDQADADYRFLRDPANRTDFWDAAKYVPPNFLSGASLAPSVEVESEALRRDEAVRQRGQLPRDVQELRGGRTSDHV
jgi:hypothetical protein